MGNASASVIVKKYDGVPKEHTASAGHLLNWKIWPGICKDSNTSLGQTCLLHLNLFFFVNVLCLYWSYFYRCFIGWNAHRHKPHLQWAIWTIYLNKNIHRVVFFKFWVGTQQGDKVSVWSFDKNEMMKRKNSPITDKTIVEQLFQIMKKDFMVIKEAVACQQIVQLIEATWVTILHAYLNIICMYSIYVCTNVYMYV